MPYMIEVYDDAHDRIVDLRRTVYPDKQSAFDAAKRDPSFGPISEAPYLLKLIEVNFYPWGWGLVDLPKG